MNLIKKTLKWALLSVTAIAVVLYATDTDYLFKAVRTVYFNGYTTAFIDDYSFFDNSVVASKDSKAWPLHKDYNKIPATEKLIKLHESQGTVAYVIIKNDSLIYEAYYDNYSENSKSNSFSMAKSYVCGLLGKAIMEGYIENLEQPVGDFFPKYSEGLSSKVTVGDLASMASGSNWKENYYWPINITAKAYYGKELEETIFGVSTVKTPGKSFEYSSGDTQLLAMVIEKATGKKLYDYLSKSLWIPLESENDALWQVDSESNDLVKAYCCIASTAKDFARLGKLYKDFGRWKGAQILDSAFVAKSIKPRFKDSPQYGYGFWLKAQNDKSFFMMEGHLGQCVVVSPSDNLIVVRLGRGKESFGHNPYNGDINVYIEEAYKMLNHAEQN
ncbi:MAG: serine hydrolase [Bacteroidota bacterium]|nr:serine hydrolase [Bacteroidota bacterium]